MTKEEKHKDFHDELQEWFEEERRMCNEAKLHFET
jgi:hypothetical protein